MVAGATVVLVVDVTVLVVGEVAVVVAAGWLGAGVDCSPVVVTSCVVSAAVFSFAIVVGTGRIAVVIADGCAHAGQREECRAAVRGPALPTGSRRN